MVSDAQRALIGRYIAAYNSFDIEEMMATIHPDIEFRNVSNGEVNASACGEAEFRKLAEQSKLLFSSRKQTITKIETELDGLSVEISYEGVLAADHPSGLRAGHTVHLTGRSEFVFREGKILRLTDYS